MVNVEKARVKSLQRFKTMHINNVLMKNLKSERKDDEDTITEYVLFAGRLIGSFIYDKKTTRITFKEEPIHDVPNQR